jgi:hypothetical protein
MVYYYCCVNNTEMFPLFITLGRVRVVDLYLYDRIFLIQVIILIIIIIIIIIININIIIVIPHKYLYLYRSRLKNASSNCNTRRREQEYKGRQNYSIHNKSIQFKKTEIAPKRDDGNILRKKLTTRRTMCLRAQKTRCRVQWSPQ